jgi:ABC-type transporter Mla subunit MlaD
MNSPVYVNIFIIVAAIAIVAQTGILLALFAAFKKSSARMETLATEVHARAIPTLDAAQGLLISTRPKVETIVDNLAAASTTVRSQVERLDATLDDVIDRTRLQVMRADELVTRTMDKVEETTDIVQRSVISPVRMASGFLQGLSAGFSTLFHRGRQPGDGIPRDEMFI